MLRFLGTNSSAKYMLISISKNLIAAFDYLFASSHFAQIGEDIYFLLGKDSFLFSIATAPRRICLYQERVHYKDG